MEIVRKKVTVIGLGKSGIAACRFLLAKGAKVSVSEAKEDIALLSLAESFEKEGLSVELGGHSRDWIRGRDLIVTSPGVHPMSLPRQWAREEGIPVISEIELGSLFCKGKMIAVTGTNGKSTVVSLLGKILEKTGKRVFVCGNIGYPLCDAIPHVQKEDWVVLEMSSFQLETCQRFHPQMAIVLNLSPDHLDWHPSFHAYVEAKRRIAQSQTQADSLLLNGDDPTVRAFGRDLSVTIYHFSRKERTNGVYLQGKEVFSSLHGKEQRICTLSSLRIQGPHNEENALAAILAASLMGATPLAIQDGLSTFEGLPHRIEFVREWDGIRFFNDSKSTTVSSTLRALESLPGPILLIAGGREKNQDFRDLAKSPLLKKVKHLFLIGEAKEKIHAAVAGKVAVWFCAALEEAVTQACQKAHPGHTVLLSPMCASFDMFHDFEERGECFKRSVEMVLHRKKASEKEEEARAL